MIKIFFKPFFVLFLLLYFFTANFVEAEDKSPVVKVGVFQLAPMVYIDDNGSPQGVFVDIIDAICDAEGWRVEYIKGTWNQGLEKVKTGEIDLMTAVMHLSRRESFLDFPQEATFNIWGQIYVHKDARISGVFDMEGKTIGGLKGGANGENFIELLSKLGIQGKFVAFNSQEDVARAIKEKRIYAGVFTNVHGYKFQQFYQLKQTQIVFDPSYLKYATAEGTNQQLLTTIDRYLSKWKNDQKSPYHKIVEKHLGLSEIHEIPYWVRLSVIIGASTLGITLFIVFFLTFFNKRLKQKVKASTQDLVIELNRREIVENILKETEEQYRRFVNQSPGISYRFSSKDGIVFWSSSIKKILGYSPEDMIQNSFIWTNSIHKDDIDSVRDAIEHAWKNQPFDLEYRIKDKNGEWHWFNDRSTRIIKGNDSVVIEGFALDITDRKIAEQELKDERDLFERIMETSPSGILRVNTDGLVIYANKRAEKILGIKMSETKPRTYNDPAWKISNLYGEYLPEKELPFNIVKNTGAPVFDIHNAIEWSDGTKILLSINASPLFNDKGGFDGIVASVEDITEKFIAEQKYQMLFTEMIDGFALHEIIYDDKGSPIDYRFLDVNPAFEKMTTLKRASVLGKTVLEIMPATESHWIEKYGRVALTGEAIFFENYSQELDRHYQVSAFRPAKNQFACIFVDVTERKKMEAHIQDAQKMESIGNLAGGIAHDFNNILFPIVGMSELLLEDLPFGSPEHENAQEILKAGKRGSDLVKQILSFGRRSEHKKIPIRIQQILREVFKLSRSTIPSNIEIKQDIQNDCGLIMADPIQIHQIAMNLITNAFHALQTTGGTISVTLKESELDHDNLKGRYAFMTVSDTGKGIDSAIIDKIFEPYFTTKKMGEGTGLGLAVVYGILKEYGGDIEVDTEPGKGSTFKVYLPLMEKSFDAMPAEDEAVCPAGHEHILLVDDEKSIARLESQMLERMGYQVISCTSSVDAVTAFKANENKFDLVITDMTMPDMTGDQLVIELKKIRMDIPIIICTGFSEKIDKDKAQAIGVKDLLMKPVGKFEMAQTVRNVLDEDKRL